MTIAGEAIIQGLWRVSEFSSLRHRRALRFPIKTNENRYAGSVASTAARLFDVHSPVTPLDKKDLPQ
jgi:hypothetical protein